MRTLLISKEVLIWIIVLAVHLILLCLVKLMDEDTKIQSPELKFALVDVNTLGSSSMEKSRSSHEAEVTTKKLPEKNSFKPKVITKPKKKVQNRKVISSRKADNEFKVIKPQISSVNPKKEKVKEVESVKETKEIVVPASSVTSDNRRENVAETQKGNNIDITSSGKNQKAGFLKTIKPPYPLQARKMGQEGAVKLGINLSEQGIVQNIKVVKSSGFSVLDNAALSAYKRVKFRPAIKNGQAIPSYIEFNVVFNLQDYS